LRTVLDAGDQPDGSELAGGLGGGVSFQVGDGNGRAEGRSYDTEPTRYPI
jgi:hypothetical protein